VPIREPLTTSVAECRTARAGQPAGGLPDWLAGPGRRGPRLRGADRSVGSGDGVAAAGPDGELAVFHQAGALGPARDGAVVADHDESEPQDLP
jgi:hypothetical protein